MKYQEAFIPIPASNVNNAAPGTAALYVDDVTKILSTKKTDNTVVDLEASSHADFSVSDGNVETSSTNASAISISTLLTNITSAGAETRTLAAPTKAGTMKIIQMTVDGGNVVLALTNIIGASGSTSATFDDVGDCLVLMSVTGKWLFLGGTATIA